MDLPANIILHIPHSSVRIPLYDGYTVDKSLLYNELNLLTDWFTDELFNLPLPKAVTSFSRIFCDVERFADDPLEIMSKVGMGMCYTKFDNGSPMRKVSPELREKIRSDYYDAHHLHIESLTSDILSRYGKAMIIDCHSYPDEPLIRDLNKEKPRPDFCLGTDDYHTPDNLIIVIKEYLISKGYSVKINNPYKGTMIPVKYYQKEKNVNGIMIEVNRKLYMTEAENKIVKNADFTKIRTLIENMIKEIPVS